MADAEPLVGRVVDERYRVGKQLGEGSVGTVYSATDLKHKDRQVALKVWHDSAMDKQTRGRFLREAKAMETLVHPNMVDIYGYGIVDDMPYMAMEKLEGQTLDDLLVDGEPIEPAVAFNIAGQMLDALAHAHERNVVHRDLKPENIFLVRRSSGRWKVKILDYGLAKFMAPDDDPTKGTALTVQGMLMGSPLYMPPEQAAGGAIDLHTDVYALGCVLFEMLTGQLPYLAESHVELVRMHMMEPIPKLSQTCPDLQVAPELQTLIETAMAKRSVKRYPDAIEMRKAFKALPEGAAQLLRGRSPLAGLVSMLSPGKIALAALVVLALAALLWLR